MIVFNYMPEQFARLALEHRRLKVSLFSDLNDPFELLAVELTDKQQRRRFHERTKQLSRTLGVLCFSRSWQSPVMWSHYADKHRGMCLGFEVSEATLMEVEYRSSRVRTKSLTSPQPTNQPALLTKQILGTKFDAWRYEREMRLLVDLTTARVENGLYFRPFGDELRLRRVIVGPRCPVGRHPIESTVNGLRDTTITKARLAFGSFSVVENQQGFRYSPSQDWSGGEGN